MTNYSYFSPGNSIVVNFASPVKSAGLAWTDGDADAVTVFEAYGPGGLLYSFGPVALADDSFQGTTAEDTFFGVQDPDGITKLIVMNMGGSGIEIDHIQYEDCSACAAVVPEPQTYAMFGFGVLGLIGFCRRNR